MSEQKTIQQLRDALEHAISIVESYEMDIRNSESIIGIDLANKGFCQGEAYTTALATIRRKAKTGTVMCAPDGSECPSSSPSS